MTEAIAAPPWAIEKLTAAHISERFQRRLLTPAGNLYGTITLRIHGETRVVAHYQQGILQRLEMFNAEGLEGGGEIEVRENVQPVTRLTIQGVPFKK